jgi:PhnB protein
MNRIIPYLSFRGNCREAMLFYHNCLGGELTFQTVGETVEAKVLPKAVQHFILEGELKKETLILRASDLIDEALQPGNETALLLECEKEREMRSYYTRLVERGECTHSFFKNEQGNLSVMLRDQFGVHWILRCGEKNKVNNK